MIDNTFTLKEPVTINESFDKVEVNRSVFALVSKEGQDPVQIMFGGILRPFRVEADGKKVYAPMDKTIAVQIDDISKQQTDPLMEDLRQKVGNAWGLITMGLGVVKGQSGT